MTIAVYRGRNTTTTATIIVKVNGVNGNLSMEATPHSSSVTLLNEIPQERILSFIWKGFILQGSEQGSIQYTERNN